jgi:hypothetical protein
VEPIGIEPTTSRVRFRKKLKNPGWLANHFVITKAPHHRIVNSHKAKS